MILLKQEAKGHLLVQSLKTILNNTKIRKLQYYLLALWVELCQGLM